MPTSRLAILAAAIALAACQKAEEKKPAGPPPALITVTQARVGAMEIAETTLGTLEAVADPKIGAEVAGKVVRVLAGTGRAVRKGELLAVIDDTDFTIQNRADEAERKRAEAVLAQQERVVERQQQLAQKGFISQNAADDARAQRDALREQLAAARARGDMSRRSQGKARVVAPFDGIVETAIASAGDYVKVGDPLFHFVSARKLRAHLPFPESAAPRLKKGQPVVLGSPLLPGLEIRAEVSDIKAGVSEAGRAIDVIVDIEGQDGLRPGGTVNASVLVSRREDALLVPEQSVVLRPAGKVVYVIAEGKALQHVVEAGARRAGMVEILKGLPAGATVALDGAGFLSHNAAVVVKETGKAAAPGAAGKSQSPQHGAAAQAPAQTDAKK
ncbi:MAG: efflux RND transporter periplasmic adaptor subunit [Rhodocyclaceae bacterium]|jgi:RND family efflux transporter MFP subunit|nr:efflux RND transporter periplasmic adaptor subunit [Rhodocyclaceae bacterium]